MQLFSPHSESCRVADTADLRLSHNRPGHWSELKDVERRLHPIWHIVNITIARKHYTDVLICWPQFPSKTFEAIAMPNTRRDEMSSSPDPLNDTPTFHGYGSSRPKSQTRRSAKPRMSIPMSGSSPKKQTFELDVGDTLSPQKIRVTVEAGESDAEGFYTNYIGGEEESPLNSHAPRDRRKERTFTTTVPVKGLSDTENEGQPAMTPKKKGRPRKSTGTPIPPKKRTRAGTPTRRATPRRKSFGEPGWEDDQDKTFSVGRSIDVPGRKRTTQSRARKGSQQKSSSPAEANDAHEMVSNSTNKKGRGRRKAMNEEDIAHLNQDNNNAGSEHDMEDNFVEHNPASSPIQSNDYSRRPNPNRKGQEDVLIARFSPGNETPRKPGWSSPKTLDATEQMDADFANQPSLSLEPLRSQHLEEPFADGLGSPSTRLGSVSSNENGQYDGEGGPEDAVDEDDHEDGNGVDQTREFDTIMESEGFSMISMDSLNHSTPWNRIQDHDTSNPPRDKSLLSIQQSAADEDVDVASQEREVEEARPAPSEGPQAEASSPKDALQDFDVSVTQHPQPKALSNLLSNPEVDDSFSTIAPEIFEAASPVKALPKSTFLVATIKNDEAYDDSFSAIPSAVLEAATPAAKRLATSKMDSSSVKASTQLNVPGSKSGLLSSLAIKSTSPRLLTPEETPSPPCESPMTKASTGGKTQPIGRVDGEPSVNEASTIFSQMPSSPPSRRYTYTAHLRQHRQLYPDAAETPSIMFSSPHLPPLVPQPNEQVGCLDGLSESRRPTLSPIAKAGRVLQDALVPSSSSRSRSQSLGSPFKSPSANRNPSSVARDCQLSPLEERREKAFPKLCLTDNFAASSNMKPQWARSAGQDDPFSSATRNHRSPSVEQKEQYTLELPHQPVVPDRFSSIRSRIGTVRSENEMSWQAEQEIEIISNQGSNVDNAPGNRRSVTPEPTRNSSTRQLSTPPRERTWAAERAAVSKQIDSAKDDQVVVINSDDDFKSHESDDEDFGLLLETMGTSSPMSWRKQGVPDESNNVTEKPRRSKLPSPWRKNSKRLVYSDELSHISSPVVEKRPHIAGNIIGDSIAKPLTARRTITSQFNNEIELDVELSDFQIPQKTNFKPRVREKGGLDLSALFAASPPKKLPVLPSNSGGISSQLNRQPDRETSFDSQSNQRARPETPEASSSPAEGKISFTPIPQKTGFTPRPRSRGAENLPSKLFDISKSTIKFGTAPSNAQSLNSFPQSRSNLPLSGTPASDLPSSPDYMNDGNSSKTSTSEKENQKADDSTLKWAENVGLAANPLRPGPLHLSPTKSILRSPLKAPAPRPGIQDSPSKAVAWVSSSPNPSSPLYRPLSATTWTRDHWLLLEQIVWSWKPENRNYGREDVYGSVRRRHDTRVVSRLVGRTVSSGGRSMVLQQWHLEAVDEFRNKVPGWEEKGVATRVFSLVVAEEDRRARRIVQASMGGGGSREV